MVGKKGRDKLRFFKFVFDEDGSEIMYLPPMIAKQVSHLVGKETKIEDKTGAWWPVTVSKVNGDLAFQRGWQKFFSDHRLEKGELLVFKYVRESHFVVRIYGLSARDRENFNDEMPRVTKRARTDPGPSVEEVPYQNFSISTRGKTVSDSDTSVASEAGRSPAPMEMEVLDLMMKVKDGSCQEEDRTIWGDLSKFEGQNVLLQPDSYRSQNVINKLAPSEDSLTDKLAPSEDSPTDKLAPSHSDVVEKAKEPEHDAERDVVQTTQIKGHSGQFVTNKFKKAVETKKASSHHESTKQAIGKGEDTHTAAVDLGWNATKYSEKPFENSNSRKREFDVSDVQNGNNKMPKGVYEAKSRFHEIPFPSSVVKNPSGKCAIKREFVEMEDEPINFPQASRGKETTRKMKVKDEPESFDDNCLPPTAFDPFSAEVKSKLYLELPEELTSFRGKTQKGKTGKIVYLKDSKGRIWPHFYPDKRGVIALCLNWSKFCDGNNINLGDKCKFHFEKEGPCIVRVDVIRKSGD